jgi:hypothetical protein
MAFQYGTPWFFLSKNITGFYETARYCAVSSMAARNLLWAGRPLNEPVAGPEAGKRGLA